SCELFFFFFSSRRRHTRFSRDWSSDVCSSDLQAAKEILAGEPAAAARKWLGPTALVMFILFGIDTVLVVSGFWLPVDIQITAFIQRINWGPVVYPLELINWAAGYWQVMVGAIAIVALF